MALYKMKQKTKVFCTSQNVIFKYKFTKLCPLITKILYLQQNFLRKNPLLSILPIIFHNCMNLKPQTYLQIQLWLDLMNGEKQNVFLISDVRVP